MTEAVSLDVPYRVRRFTAISGTYFSLQHLSLSDAMVLKFFVPFLTGLSGAIFLKEPYTIKEILVGCKNSLGYFRRTGYLLVSVCSFFGVMLIARPPFLFGSPQSDHPMGDTPAQRMISVMLEFSFSSHAFVSYCTTVRLLLALSLLPVPVSLVYVIVVRTFISVFSDTLIRAIGKRAHAMHCVTFFSSQSVLVSMIGYVSYSWTLHFRRRPL